MMSMCVDLKSLFSIQLRSKYNNQNNKYINSSSLGIQLRNYSEINPKSLAFHGFDGIHDNMMKERNIKRRKK